MDTNTFDWQNRTDLDDGVFDQVIDLVLNRINAEEGVTRDALHDWRIAHPRTIDDILFTFITSGNVLLIDGGLYASRLPEYV